MTTTSSSTALPRRRYLFGPIFTGTLVRDGHRARTHWTRAFCFVVVAVIVMSYLFSDASRERRMDAYWMSRIGQAILLIIALGQVSLATLLGPMLTGGTISSERSDGTLEVLLTTDITATQLVLGKSFTRTLELMLALLWVMPIGALIMWYGGISAQRLILIEALVLLTVLVAGAVGTFFSSLTRAGYRGIVASSFFLPLVWGGVPLALALAAEARAISWDTMAWIGLALTPFGPVGFWVAEPSERILKATTIACFIFNGLLAFGLMWGSILVMRWRPHIEGGGWVRRAIVAVTEELRRLLGRRRSWAGIRGNPIVWRELHRRFLGGWTLWAIILIAGLLIMAVICGLAYATHNLDDEDFRVATTIILTGILFLVTSITAGTAFAPERETQSFDLLCLTSLTRRQLLVGKLLGVLRIVLLPAALLVVSLAVMDAATGPRHTTGSLPNFVPHWSAWATFLVLMLAHILFFSWAGLWMSLRCRRTATAVGMSVLWPIFFCVGTLLVVALVDEWAHLHEEEFYYFATNPAAAYALFSASFEQWLSMPYGDQLGLYSLCQLFWLVPGCWLLMGACSRRLKRLGPEGGGREARDPSKDTEV